ncbi:MAG: hypothetical protein ACRD8Z_23150 [Nitrososphaeraceae archaeon]
MQIGRHELFTKLDLTFVPDHVRALLVKYIELEPLLEILAKVKCMKMTDSGKSNKDSSASTILYDGKLSLEDFKNIMSGDSH